jgi:polyvinyl alcohol dehydrogenase (cytochrome)
MHHRRITLLFTALLCAAAVASMPLPPIVQSTAAGQSDLPGCAQAEHQGGEWRSYNHDQSNTRSQPAEEVIGTLEVPTLQPAFVIGASDAGGSGDITGTPTIADGCLYFGTNGGWIVAANADTGEPVWATEVPDGGGVNSSITVEGGRVFAGVSRVSQPYVVSLDQATGALLWATVTDTQRGADTYGSPVIHDGLLFMGVSGGSAELGDESDRYAFQGAFVLIRAYDEPQDDGSVLTAGDIVKKTWTVHPPMEPDDEFAGVTIWSTPAVDVETGYAYVGSGNPFKPEAEHEYANSVLKIDMNRDSETFGEIVASYKGQVEEYFPEVADTLPCVLDFPGNPPPYYPQGLGACTDIDLDFGASPNLFTAPDGRTLVGTGQKSGVYHVADADTMELEWTALVGPPSPIGGVVGSTAYANDQVVGPIVPAGYLWGVDAITGSNQWFSPIGDGAHWGNPVSVANGVAYTVDFAGSLNAFDTATGAPLLKRPMIIDAQDASNSWGGVAIARNTVYAAIGMTGLPEGHVIAYRLSADTPEIPEVPGEVPTPSGTNGTHIVTTPGSQYYGYVTRAMVAQRDGTLTYTNSDVVRHDVVQDPRKDGVAGDGSAPWCNRFNEGECPLFWTELIGLSQQVIVQGVNETAPGTYSYYCSLHPGMVGTLVIQ